MIGQLLNKSPVWFFKQFPVSMWTYRSSFVYYPFQFEVSLRKAAEQLAHIPPKTLLKPQVLHQHPFSVAKLRHVDQTQVEPQFESPEPSESPPSCHSAICFMTRVLHRLREVDEHMSEVNFLCFLLCLVSFCCMF